MATEQQGPEEQPDTGSAGHLDGEQPDTGPAGHLDRDDPDHSFVDRSVIDFDPDVGLYAGTAVDGTTEIPGPHMDEDSGEASDEAEHHAPNS